MAQRVGDRDDPSWSVKTIAFTVPANPMSDRVQLVMEVYETEIYPIGKIYNSEANGWVYHRGGYLQPSALALIAECNQR